MLQSAGSSRVGQRCFRRQVDRHPSAPGKRGLRASLKSPPCNCTVEFARWNCTVLHHCTMELHSEIFNCRPAMQIDSGKLQVQRAGRCVAATTRVESHTRSNPQPSALCAQPSTLILAAPLPHSPLQAGRARAHPPLPLPPHHRNRALPSPLPPTQPPPGLRVQGLGFRVQSLGFRVQGVEFRVWGLGLRWRV